MYVSFKPTMFDLIFVNMFGSSVSVDITQLLKKVKFLASKNIHVKVVATSFSIFFIIFFPEINTKYEPVSTKSI